MLNLLNDCCDFELLKANLSTEQLCSIEEILNNCGDSTSAETDEGLYGLVMDWFIGNIEAEKLIEGVLSIDNFNDSILDMFESVEIKNNSRLSDEDAEFCMKQQALYEKVKAHYAEMHSRLQALNQFDGGFYKDVSDDNAYHSGSYEYKIYEKEFFKFGEDDFLKLIIMVHNIFLKQINRYFRDKYRITIEDKEAVIYLGLKKPKEPEPPYHFYKATEEEKAAYKAKKQSYELEYKQYVQNITSATLHYDCVVDDIFMLLGAFTFAEQAEQEIKDGAFNAGRRSVEVRSRKIVFDILSSYKCRIMDRYEISLDGQDYKSLLRALSYFDSDKRNVAIYDSWLGKFVNYKKYESDGIYGTHSANGSKVINFKYYKNGKFEVEFVNHKTALEFAHEFLGYKEEAA